MDIAQLIRDYNHRLDSTLLSDEEVRARIDLSGLENIDGAVLNWVNGMNLFYESANGWQRAPITWLGAERAWQIKNEKELHDRSGTLQLPMITVNRSVIGKAPDKKGIYWANIPAIRDLYKGVLPIARTRKPLKTSEFANNEAYRGRGVINYRFAEDEVANPGEPVVYEYQMVPIPVYLDFTYEINIATNYIQHANQLLTPFLTYLTMGNGHYFVVSKDKWRYEAFMDQKPQTKGNDDNLGEEERRRDTLLSLHVLGYVFEADRNSIREHIIKREGVTSVKFGAEYE